MDSFKSHFISLKKNGKKVKNDLPIFRNSFGKEVISSRLSRKVLLPYSVTNSSFSALLLLTSEPSEWNSDTRTFAKVPKPDVLMNMGDRGRMEFVGSTARQIWLPVNVRGRMSDTAIFRGEGPSRNH